VHCLQVAVVITYIWQTSCRGLPGTCSVQDHWAMPPCPFTSLSFPLLLFSFFHWLYLLSSFVPPVSTRIVPLRFQAGGRRKWPNLGLVCCVCLICIPYLRWILVFCSIWFSLVLCVPSVLWHCWLGHLTRKNQSSIWPIMCLDVKPYSINHWAMPASTSSGQWNDGVVCAENLYDLGCIMWTKYIHSF